MPDLNSLPPSHRQHQVDQEWTLPAGLTEADVANALRLLGDRSAIGTRDYSRFYGMWIQVEHRDGVRPGDRPELRSVHVGGLLAALSRAPYVRSDALGPTVRKGLDDIGMGLIEVRPDGGGPSRTRLAEAQWPLPAGWGTRFQRELVERARTAPLQVPAGGPTIVVAEPDSVGRVVSEPAFVDRVMDQLRRGGISKERWESGFRATFAACGIPYREEGGRIYPGAYRPGVASAAHEQSPAASRRRRLDQITEPDRQSERPARRPRPPSPSAGAPGPSV